MSKPSASNERHAPRVDVRNRSTARSTWFRSLNIWMNPTALSLCDNCLVLERECLCTFAHIFNDLAIFHNQKQVLALLLQYREVVERIPVHHEHIRQGSWRQHTEFASAIEYGGVGGGGALQDFKRREDLGP